MTTRVTSPKSGKVHAKLARKAKGGQEIWHVHSNGTSKILTTSSTSITAMDEAMSIYKGALKRLAKR